MMKRRRSPSLSPNSASGEKKKFSKYEVQKMIEQEVHSAVEQTETKLECLLEKVQQMECEIKYESAIHNLQVWRGDAALIYIRKLGINGTQDKTQEKSSLPSPAVTAKLDITRPDSEDEIVSHMDKKRMGDHGELFQQTMETTKTALKKMHTDNEALKAALADLKTDPPPPTRCGSPVSPQRKKMKKKVEEQKADRMKVKCLSGGNNSSPEHTASEKPQLSYPPLPAMPFPSVLSMEAASYNIPQRPTLQLALIRNPPGLSVLWNMEEEDPSGPPMDSYSIFMAMEKVKGSGVFPEWKTLGEVRAIPLPMCVMISKYKPGFKACFTVVGKDQFGRYGPYSKIVPASIPE